MRRGLAAAMVSGVKPVSSLEGRGSGDARGIAVLLHHGRQSRDSLLIRPAACSGLRVTHVSKMPSEAPIRLIPSIPFHILGHSYDAGGGKLILWSTDSSYTVTAAQHRSLPSGQGLCRGDRHGSHVSLVFTHHAVHCRGMASRLPSPVALPCGWPDGPERRKETHGEGGPNGISTDERAVSRRTDEM